MSSITAKLQATRIEQLSNTLGKALRYDKPLLSLGCYSNDKTMAYFPLWCFYSALGDKSVGGISCCLLFVPRLSERLLRGQDYTNRLPTANWLSPSITSEPAPQSEADPAAIWEKSVGPHQEKLYKDKARFVWKMLSVRHAGQPRNGLQEMMSNLPRSWANLFRGHLKATHGLTTCQGKGSFQPTGLFLNANMHAHKGRKAHFYFYPEFMCQPLGQRKKSFVS